VIPVNNYLVISAVGPNRPDVIAEFTRACTQCGCNILNSKINLFGQELTIALFVSGNWGAIAKMETTLPSLEQRLGLNIMIRRTTDLVTNNKSMLYNIQIVAIDKLGILNGLSDFLLRLGIPIEEITANTYISHTGTRMANLTIKIDVPDTLHLATLRDQFISYCDDNNLDAYLEPLRSL
jgi:glycine cleavage system transcriptional repressor